MKKTQNAVKKAWKSLSKDERKGVIAELTTRGMVSGGLGGLLALSVTNPNLMVVLAPATISAIIGSGVMARLSISGDTGKFARRIEKYAKRPLHRIYEKLEKVI